jgi:hypothetical protein
MPLGIFKLNKQFSLLKSNGTDSRTRRRFVKRERTRMFAHKEQEIARGSRK